MICAFPFIAAGSPLLRRLEYAARSAARVVHDIQNDVIDSFRRPPGEAPLPGLKRADEMRILLEETDDNLDFGEMVREEVMALDCSLRNQVLVVPSLQQTSERERERYLAAPALDWSVEQREELLARVGESGHRIEQIDLENAFVNVKLITLEAGETLLEAGRRRLLYTFRSIADYGLFRWAAMLH